MSTTPEQIVDRISGALVQAAPDNWTQIHLEVRASVLAREFELSVTLGDGRPATMEIPPEVKSGLVDLRPLMYEPGRGTWFSASLTLVAPDQRETAFNYDDDPQWWPDLPPVMFSSDLAEFPRGDEHIPGWLQDKLAQAALGERTATDTVRPDPGSDER